MTRRSNTKKAPDHFSTKLPTLQLAWDATSLYALDFCPRYYQYTIVEGWRGNKVDLEFGIYYASACERFYRARLDGKSLEEATEEATDYVLKATWDKKSGEVWGGEYANTWHCTGTEKYKPVEGKGRKCPHAKSGVWYFDEPPSSCGECGSPIETIRQYVPNSKVKNRVTLVRAVIWYCLNQPEQGGLQPIRFENGTAAVELPFRVPLPMTFSTGEVPLLCGYFDRLSSYVDETWIVDQKTTSQSLSQKYFNSFAPSIQFDTYDLVGSMIFPDLDVQGVMNDACQVTQTEARYGRREYRKTETQRQEHIEWIESLLKKADEYAVAGVWPMRKSSCRTCPFNVICSVPPIQRERLLNMTMKKGERWNPLEER